LLLDISDNENYTWTYDFDPSPPSESLKIVQQSDKSSNNTPTIISIIIGSLLGCSLISFSLYKLNKNNHKHLQQNTMAIDHF